MRNADASASTLGSLTPSKSGAKSVSLPRIFSPSEIRLATGKSTSPRKNRFANEVPPRAGTSSTALFIGAESAKRLR